MSAISPNPQSAVLQLVHPYVVVELLGRMLIQRLAAYCNPNGCSVSVPVVWLPVARTHHTASLVCSLYH